MQIREAVPRWAVEQLDQQVGVLATADAVRWLGRAAVRWRLETGRWQRACRGVVVTHAGQPTASQLRWAAVLGSGDGAVLAGLTAASLSGLSGFEDGRIHLLVPASRRVRPPFPGVAVHRSVLLAAADIQPARLPPRTRVARSLLDAAAWAATDDRARATLAAGVQQRIVRADDLRAVLAGLPRIHRHALIRSTLEDIAGGAEALSELDFCRLTRRYGLPEPERQVIRRDAAGRRRWLDCYWHSARVVVEVDGMWHMEAQAWWADMRRDNDLTVQGYRVLRFPAFAVREHPAAVAAQIAAALTRAVG